MNRAGALGEVRRDGGAVHDEAQVDHQRGQHHHGQDGAAGDEVAHRELGGAGEDDERHPHRRDGVEAAATAEAPEIMPKGTIPSRMGTTSRMPRAEVVAIHCPK